MTRTLLLQEFCLCWMRHLWRALTDESGRGGEVCPHQEIYPGKAAAAVESRRRDPQLQQPLWPNPGLGVRRIPTRDAAVDWPRWGAPSFPTWVAASQSAVRLACAGGWICRPHSASECGIWKRYHSQPSRNSPQGATIALIVAGDGLRYRLTVPEMPCITQFRPESNPGAL